MSQKLHLEQLILKHKKLDLMIKEGYSNYLDDAHLKKLKQEKLMLKQQIERLQQEITE